MCGMRPSSLAPQVKRAAVVPAGVPSRPWVETGPTAQGWRHPNDGDLRGGKTLSELGLSMLGRRSYYGDMPKRESPPSGGSSRRRGNKLALVEVRTLKNYADGESPFLEAYVGAGDPGVDVMWTFSVTQPHQELEVRFGNGAAAAYAHQVFKRCAELDSLIATHGDPTGGLAKEKLFRLRCAASTRYRFEVRNTSKFEISSDFDKLRSQKRRDEISTKFRRSELCGGGYSKECGRGEGGE